MAAGTTTPAARMAPAPGTTGPTTAGAEGSPLGPHGLLSQRYAAAVSEWEMVLRVVVAAVLGGMVGYDRAAAHKPAGVRTHAMVSAGAALFVAISILVSSGIEAEVALVDGRVLAGVTTGVGFLGAGTIIRREGSVSGLSTAAGVWVVAGIGATVAMGYWWLAVLTTVLVIAIQASSSLDKLPEKETEKQAERRMAKVEREAEAAEERVEREHD